MEGIKKALQTLPGKTVVASGASLGMMMAPLPWGAALKKNGYSRGFAIVGGVALIALLAFSRIIRRH